MRDANSFKVTLFIGVLSISIETTYAQERPAFEVLEDNTVIIRGKRKERSYPRVGGQTTVIKPNDASRFDSVTHLQKESSLQTAESGRVSPSGFVVPRIRGQDTKLTDVYLEGMAIQDPYTGLPLIEDLDLRAFGSLEIHQGLVPFDLAGFNPIGAIRYHMDDLERSKLKLGTQIGRPYGASGWVRGDYLTEQENPVLFRLYGRSHVTDGKHSFYNDNGTPYNMVDDYEDTRQNNDQRSYQALPYLKIDEEAYTVETFAWLYGAERGLPSLSPTLPSYTRENVKGHVASVKYSRMIFSQQDFGSLIVAVRVGSTGDERKINDPGRRFIFSGEESKLQVQTQRYGFDIHQGPQEFKNFLSLDQTQSVIQSNVGSRSVADTIRQTTAISYGFKLESHDFLVLETKAALKKINDKETTNVDRVILGEESIEDSRARMSKAIGSSVAFKSSDASVYVQMARSERVPSLIEEYGNGSSIRPNYGLKSEKIFHKETGFFLTPSFLPVRFGLAFYQDLMNDKIIFVPIMANASKADNVRQTDVLGVDGKLEFEIRSTSLYLSGSKIFPYDKTRSEQKILPGIPQTILVAEVEQKLRPFTARWTSRYRSAVYRDLGNSVRIPESLLHDVSLDWSAPWSGFKTEVGLLVRNIFDVKSVPIEAPQTEGSRGRTALSDIAGSPLPGRQWILSVTATL